MATDNIIIDQFADIRVLRYDVPGFKSLSPARRVFLYHLAEAALWGRDIFWHQNGGAASLEIRRAVEAVYVALKKNGSPDARLVEYAKRIWFANGVHHHYSNDKMMPLFSSDEFVAWAAQCGISLSNEALRLMFDPDYKAKKVSLDTTGDVVRNSAVNFYSGDLSQAEVEEFYKGNHKHPLNSLLVKMPDGSIEEKVWRLDGMYAEAIEHIVEHLRKAQLVACNSLQAKAIGQLIEYYTTGNPDTFDQFNISWVADKESDIDFINGFIEVYNDPMGLKATWESIVELKDEEASRQIELIAAHAQWFEDHSPVDELFKKKQVSGVSMNVIDAVMLGGDCYPATPIGVNLPNADWIREQYGSKSISLANITAAHHEAGKSSGVLDEFALSDAEKERCRKFGRPSDDLHTQLHECLGHGSGQMRAGVTLEDLKAYGSTIEEARADLFALYFMADPKMQELGITECAEVAWTHYDAYLRSGLLVQLARIDEGRVIEEAHMRNRALVCRWVMEKAALAGGSPACEMVVRNGKHYAVVNDYEALRTLFGDLLREVQRIKSEGDYEAARALVEDYGVAIDPVLHAEVRARYAALGIAPFSGFVNPVLSPVVASDGSVADAEISYSEAFDEQMLRYSRDYSVAFAL